MLQAFAKIQLLVKLLNDMLLGGGGENKWRGSMEEEEKVAGGGQYVGMNWKKLI